MNINREFKKLQKRGAKFTVAPGRFNTERHLETLNGKAWMNIYIDPNTRTLELSHGETNKNVRGKGYGMLLRAIPILAASKSKNINYVTHTSSFLNNNQRRKYTVPPSRRIVQYLGLVPVTNTSERLVLKNMNKVTKKRVQNAAFGRKFNKNAYNKIVGARKIISYERKTKKKVQKPKWYTRFLRV